MAAVQYEEDRPLSDAEQECAAAALAAAPQELVAGAFGGDKELLTQLLSRCVRGEKQNAAKSLLSTLQWRKDMDADTVRRIWLRAPCCCRLWTRPPLARGCTRIAAPPAHSGNAVYGALVARLVLYSVAIAPRAALGFAAVGEGTSLL